VVTLFLLFVFGAGGWALFRPNAGEQTTGPIERIAEPQRNAPDAPAARRAENPGGGNAPTGNTVVGETSEEPALPLSQAEQAVFDMYVEESFQTPETSWAYLSERLQREVGSPEQWAEQEQIYDLYYVYFTRYPAATASGETAEVTFEVRLDRSAGQELLSGTWVCIIEDGEWKLDRLENERVQPI
jgi:eukaryotic-like serine/threonine-protein kinase